METEKQSSERSKNWEGMLLFSLFLTLYVFSYFVLRFSHVLVHQSYDNSIIQGYYAGEPMARGKELIGKPAEFIFTPLRVIEKFSHDLHDAVQLR